jgi:hypothetical protein
MSGEVKMLLARHHAMTQLRKLLLLTSSLVSFPFLPLDGCPQLAAGDEDNQTNRLIPVAPGCSEPGLKTAFKAIHGMCQEVYGAMVYWQSHDILAEAGSSLKCQRLMELLAGMKDIQGFSEPDTLLSTMFGNRLNSTISDIEFADFILKFACS